MRKPTNAELITRLLQTTRFETAEFGRIGPDTGKDFPQREADVTAFIKERTRLYRESWVEPVIVELAKRLKVVL